jgi:hypothetical protein
MRTTPRHFKVLLRQAAAIAHDRELSTALRDLRAEFDGWERGDITADELNDRIHRFHDGTSREIWRRYATNHLEPVVAIAVAMSVLSRDELPKDLLDHLASLIESYEQDSLR